MCGVGHFGETPSVPEGQREHAGAEYVCADGGRIPNLGEKVVRGLTTEGGAMNIKFQVTQVENPLLSVAKLTSAGHSVEFGDHGGVITHGKTRATTTFVKKNGVYVLDVWVPVAPCPGGRRQ